MHAHKTIFITVALLLAGCAEMPTHDGALNTAPALPHAAPAPTPAPPSHPTPSAPVESPAPRADTTFTLPSDTRVSLARYRTQMRARLMETEGAAAMVADCAAHASWVVPRSTNFDALKIPQGALRQGRAEIMPWQGRFSPVKQAVPVSQVVVFDAEGQRRGATNDWVPMKVRCGYQDGMMLAYELLDANGTTIGIPARAAPSRAPAARKAAANKRGAKASSTSRSKAGAKASSKKAQRRR